MRTTKRIARLHARIACKRLDFLHKVTTNLVKRLRVICIEALNIKGMMASAQGTIESPGTNVRQKSGLNRSIADAAWGTFLGTPVVQGDMAPTHSGRGGPMVRLEQAVLRVR